MTLPARPLAPHVAAALGAVQAKPSPQGQPAATAPHVRAALGACAQARFPVSAGPRPPALHVQLALSRQPAASSTSSPALRPAVPPAAQRAFRPPGPTPIAQPYRPPAGVVQRSSFDYSTVNVKDPNTYASSLFSWDGYGEYLERAGKREGKEKRQKSNKTLSKISKEISKQHLDKFQKGTDKITEKTPPNEVLVLASASGGGTLKDVGEKDSELEAAITKPDDSKEVEESRRDGEVKPLIAHLKAFRAHLKKNAAKDLTFTLAFSGSHGACDGCKKRIETFVDLWARAANAVMEKGRTATLKVTYKYLVPAIAFPRKWGETLYGWKEDGEDSPLFHTIEATVRG